MSVPTSNPEALHRPIGYSHVAAYTGNLAFVAGQVALGPDGNLVGEGDLATITTFVVEYRVDLIAPIRQAREAVFGDHLPASTLVGVQALARPEFLIEVEAVAVTG